MILNVEFPLLILNYNPSDRYIGWNDTNVYVCVYASVNCMHICVLVWKYTYMKMLICLLILMSECAHICHLILPHHLHRRFHIIYCATVLLLLWCDTIDPFDKSHNASDKYPTIHHFVTEMCTFLLQSGALWDMGLVHCGIYEMDLLWPIVNPWRQQGKRTKLNYPATPLSEVNVLAQRH